MDETDEAPDRKSERQAGNVAASCGSVRTAGDEQMPHWGRSELGSLLMSLHGQAFGGNREANGSSVCVLTRPVAQLAALSARSPAARMHT